MQRNIIVLFHLLKKKYNNNIILNLFKTNIDLYVFILYGP